MKKKGIILTLILVAATFGSALGVVYFRFSSLPHPNVASHNQLMYWMVLRDLKDYEKDVHVALVNRFADEAETIFAKNNASEAALSDSQSERLLSNIELLKKVWFEDRIAQYCDISRPETCEAFMQKQIQLLDDFGNIAFEHAKILYPEKSSESLTTVSDELFADIDNWIEETPVEKKDETLKAIREATVFWLSTEDLGDQVMEARQQLVDRVIAELKQGMNLEATTSIVNNERAKNLKQNAILLVEAWIYQLADTFSQLPSDKRSQFVDDRIAEVKGWKLLEYLGESQSNPNSVSSYAAITQFNRTFKDWIDKASEPHKTRLKKLKIALQQRILVSFLNSGGN